MVGALPEGQLGRPQESEVDDTIRRAVAVSAEGYSIDVWGELKDRQSAGRAHRLICRCAGPEREAAQDKRSRQTPAHRGGDIHMCAGLTASVVGQVAGE